MNIKSWIERLIELTNGYDLEDQWNMDELGLFFKVLADRGLVKKTKKSKGDKKSKRLKAAFFATADRSKVTEPIAIWKSKSPRCFKKV